MFQRNPQEGLMAHFDASFHAKELQLRLDKKDFPFFSSKKNSPRWQKKVAARATATTLSICVTAFFLFASIVAQGNGNTHIPETKKNLALKKMFNNLF